jgi:hypothetical protein
VKQKNVGHVSVVEKFIRVDQKSLVNALSSPFTYLNDRNRSACVMRVIEQILSLIENVTRIQ